MPSMTYAISLRPDSGPSQAVDGVWRRLAAAGVADDMLALNYGPHVTLAVYDELDENEAAAVIKNIAARYSSPLVSISSLGIFPAEKSVLWAGPTPDKTLLELHADLHRELAAKCHPHYLPGAWVPHFTLAGYLTSSALAEALAMLAPAWQTVSGRFVRLELVSFPPVEVLQGAQFTG